MENHKKLLTCFLLFFALILIGSAAHAASIMRLEKDVPMSEITGAPNNVTFDIYDSASAATPVATQTFPRGEWSADYDFTKFGTVPESMVRFKADFSNTASITIDMQLWVEIKLDGVVKGPRQRVKKECRALFSEKAYDATTAESADWAADADLLDGMDSSEFLTGAHPHDGSDITTGTVAEPRIAAAVARDSEVMPTVLANDGPGSTVDADTLDGMDSTAFLTGAHTHDGSDITGGTIAATWIDVNIARDNEIMPTVLANDGPGSTMDADTLDGTHASGFVTQAEHDALRAEMETLLAGLYLDIGALMDEVEALKDKLAYMTVQTGTVNGLAGPHVVFEGANVHVRSGSGTTNDGGTLTGRGNLIVGYNEQLATPVVGRGGSHNLVVGYRHEYSSYAGLVAGFANTVSGTNASVSGGYENTAGGSYASVSGGRSNAAIDYCDSVSGGGNNTADGYYASVSGGRYNTAGSTYASVSGGYSNEATYSYASVTGGYSNTASSSYASVSGGYSNRADDEYASVSGGRYNLAQGSSASISGGDGNTATGAAASISGGWENQAVGGCDSVAGGRQNTAEGGTSFIGGGTNNGTTGMYSSITAGRNNHATNSYASISGGNSNVATGEYSSVSGGISNSAGGMYSSVSGGGVNAASEHCASVSGGQYNTATSLYASVSGGKSRNAGNFWDWAAGDLLEDD